MNLCTNYIMATKVIALFILLISPQIYALVNPRVLKDRTWKIHSNNKQWLHLRSLPRLANMLVAANLNSKQKIDYFSSHMAMKFPTLDHLETLNPISIRNSITPFDGWYNEWEAIADPASYEE